MDPRPVADNDLPLPHLIAHRARTSPDAPFLVDVGGRELTYEQVFVQASHWARAFALRGINRGDRVATMVPTSIDSILSWLGAAFLGAINVPLNVAYRGSLLEHALRLTDPSILVIDQRLTPLLATVPSDAVPPVVIRSHDDGHLVEAGAELLADFVASGAIDPLPPRADIAWSDVATLMFTSGTTGPSKAVVMPWRQVHESAAWVWQGHVATSADRNYVPWPTNHISGAGGVYVMAIAGGTAILREKWSTSRFMDDVYDYRCTMVSLQGAMVQYVQAMELPTGRGDCPLEHVFVAPVDAQVDGLMNRLGAAYCTDYNSTELSGPIVSNRYQPVPVGSCGLRRPGVQLRIVDKDGRDVPLGHVGELLVRTDDPNAMNQGYWGMPEATAKAWADGWFHTGDHLREDADGHFYYVGRIKDVVRVRGENVSAHELEMMLNSCPDISESAVIGEPDGHGEEQIVAFVMVRSDEVLPESLTAYSEEHLPRFMVPYRFVIVDELPRTPTGKVRKDVLRAEVAN